MTACPSSLRAYCTSRPLRPETTRPAARSTPRWAETFAGESSSLRASAVVDAGSPSTARMRRASRPAGVPARPARAADGYARGRRRRAPDRSATAARAGRAPSPGRARRTRSASAAGPRRQGRAHRLRGRGGRCRSWRAPQGAARPGRRAVHGVRARPSDAGCRPRAARAVVPSAARSAAPTRARAGPRAARARRRGARSKGRSRSAARGSG